MRWNPVLRCFCPPLSYMGMTSHACLTVGQDSSPVWLVLLQKCWEWRANRERRPLRDWRDRSMIRRQLPVMHCFIQSNDKMIACGEGRMSCHRGPSAIHIRSRCDNFITFRNTNLLIFNLISCPHVMLSVSVSYLVWDMTRDDTCWTQKHAKLTTYLTGEKQTNLYISHLKWLHLNVAQTVQLICLFRTFFVVLLVIIIF